MAFSCYFNTAIGRLEKKCWKLNSTNSVEWSVEEEWIMSAPYYDHNCGVRTDCIQKITLQSKEITDYCAQVVVCRSDNLGESIVKYQDLSKSKVINILESEYNKKIPNRRNDLNCALHLFCRCNLTDARLVIPVPLDETIISKAVVTPKTEKKLDKLAHDMSNLLKSGFCSDVVLISGKQKIKAHKGIISARSEVFAKMFSTAMKENLMNEVSISDIEGPVLQEMVSYMYSGVIVFEDAVVVRGVYVAADKYAVEDLKTLCSSWLKNVTQDTVLDALILAETYKDTALKKVAMTFISKDILKLKLLSTWRSFGKTHPSLCIESLEYALENPE